MKAPIDKCPHCGSNYGYYTKDYIVGKCNYNFHFDGSEAYNGAMYDGLLHRFGKYAYCTNCNKRLFRVFKMERWVLGLEFEKSRHCISCIVRDEVDDVCKMQNDESGCPIEFDTWEKQMENCPLQKIE